MICKSVRCTFLAVFFVAVYAEVVYKWDKTKILPQMGLNNWRATSFAFTKDKIFLTLVDVEKQYSGNGVVGAFNKSSSKSPDVSIFPFQNFYRINDPDRGKITTPMCVRTDECERLWLLDSAVQNISGIQIKSSPGIYIFNTRNSQLIRSFNLPMSQWSSNSFFVNFVVSTENVEHDCEQSYGYFADFNRFHLLTYDFLRNKSELKSHPYFSPDPLIHTPNAILFNPRHQDLNGIFGLALAEYHSPEVTDTLYFHPLANTHEFRISTRVLKSEGNLNYGDVEVFKDKGENAESGVSAFDPETDTIFFAEVNTKKIGGFRLKESKDPKMTTYYRYDFQLKSGYIVDLNVQGPELWVLVDDKSDITVYKLPIADINVEFHRSAQHQPKNPPSANSAASHINFQLVLYSFFLFLVFFENKLFNIN